MSPELEQPGAAAPGAARVVDEAIDRIGQIATLPEVTMKIIGIVQDPTSASHDLYTVIVNDVALSTRILKVINSAFYGLSGHVGSIDRAISLLGMSAVRNIAISASLSRLYRGGDLCPRFSGRALWTHSVAAGVAGKLLCDELRVGPADEIFLGGLLHDIGIVVEMQALPKQLVQVFDALPLDPRGVPTEDMRRVEREVLGADHEAFGARLCERWNFPAFLGAVTGGHHDPLAVAGDGGRRVCLVHVADRLAAAPRYGFRDDLMSLEIAPEVLDRLHASPAITTRISQRLPAACAEIEVMFP